MKFWIDIENSSGARYGSGPITTATEWESAPALSGAGTFSFRMPAGDAKAALIENKRIARCYQATDDGPLEVGAGIIDSVETEAGPEGVTMLVVSGDDLMRELTKRQIGSLTIDDGGGGETTTGPSLVMAYAPSGWSLSGSSSTAILHEFEGESVLNALVRLAEMTGESFRLGTGRQIVWLTSNADSGKRLFYGMGAFVDDEKGLITRITQKQDSYDAITRVYPYGIGNGDNRVDLGAATWTPPSGYTLNPSNNYIVLDTETSDTRTERYLNFKDISDDNTLAKAAYMYLSKRVDTGEFFEIECLLDAVLYPGQTVRVIARQFLDSYQTLDVDDDLIIREIKTRIDNNGVRMVGVTVSNVDRPVENDATAIISQSVTSRDAYTYDQPGEATGGDADTLDGYSAEDFYNPQYLTLQAEPNLTQERILTAGTAINLTDGGAGGNLTIAVDPTDVDHDSLLNFVANEHIDHSAVTLTAGDGLTGGGTIAASRTFNVDVTDFIDTSYGLTESANDIRVNAGDGLDFDTGALAVDVTDLIDTSYGLTESSNDIRINAGDGLDFDTGALVLGTPGTLSVSSANGLTTTSHTHEITSSSNPGAAASILASDASGYLQLTGLGIGTAASSTQRLRLVQWVTATSGTYMGSFVESYNSNASSASTVTITGAGGTVYQNSVYSVLGLQGVSIGIGTLQAGDIGYAYAGNYSITNSQAGTITSAIAFGGSISNSGTGTISNAYGGYINIAESAGEITNAFGFYVYGIQATTNAFGLYVANLSSAINNYAIYTNAGLVHLGDQLKVSGSQDIVQTIVQAHSTQTNDMFQIQNSSGVTRFSVDDGYALNLLYDASNYTSLNVDSGGDLTIAPTGGDILIDGATLSTDHWVSQTTGWGATYAGVADFRSIYADELHVQAFIADIYQSMVGAIIITESRGRLSRDFTIPNTGVGATIYFEDLEGWEGTQLFASGDYVLLRVIDTSGGGLVVADVYGQVTSYTDLSGGEQSWTFTTTTTGYSSADTIYAGAIALDYGPFTGGGIWEATVLDAAGSPYSQVTTWDTIASGEPSNFTTHVRLGNLDGISGIGAEYGLWAGQGTANDDPQVILSDSQASIRNVDLTIHDGSNEVIVLDSSTPYLAVGLTAPTDYNTGDGFWVGNDSGTYKMHLGDTDGEKIIWDGSLIAIFASNNGYMTFSGNDLNFFATGVSTLALDGATGAGRFGPSASDHVYVSSVGVQIKDSSVVRGEWQTDGDIFIGSDISAAGTTYLSVFATAQTYNSESMAAGDMLIGDNSASKANILWDYSAGQLLFRGGGTTQAYIDTDGTFTAGGGDVAINSNGITITTGAGTSNKITFDGSTGYGHIYTNESSGDVTTYLNATSASGSDADILISTFAGGTGDTSTIQLQAAVLGTPIFAYLENAAGTGRFYVQMGGSSVFDVYSTYTKVTNDLRVGSGVLLGNTSTDPEDKALGCYVRSGNPSTITNTAQLFAKDISSSAELFAMDEAGNATQLSPHDPETGEWIFYSENVKTGRRVRVNLEQLVKAVEEMSGKQFAFYS